MTGPLRLSEGSFRWEWAELSAEKERGEEEAGEDVCLGTQRRITQDAQSGHLCVLGGQIHGVIQCLAHTFPLFSWLP